MRHITSLLPHGVRRLFRLPRSRTRMLREFDDEVRFHFEMRVREMRARGLSEDAAEAEARRRFGDLEEYRRYAERRASRRARWHAFTEWFQDGTQDVRFAARQARKNPAFTALAVLTLALGIGANTAIFTVVHRLLIAPLPYPDGDRIVALMQESGDRLGPASGAALLVWRQRARSLDMIASVSIDAIMVQSGEEQDTVHALITSNYMQVLGVRPALGRGFTEADEHERAGPVAMISHGLWQRKYGGRSDVLGATLNLEGRPYTIVGVTPPEMVAVPMAAESFRMHLREASPSIWLPASLDSINGGDGFAKLRQGVSAKSASSELQATLDSVPDPRRERVRVRAMRAQDFLDARETRTMEVLFVAVGVLLLIACANVANLLTARAWTRRREFAVRVALGAGRWRVARQVLTESSLLALTGGALGVGVAWQTLGIVIAMRPQSLEHLDKVHLESTVLLWSAGISVVTGLLFGCAPALLAGARFVGDLLRGETRAGTGGMASHRMRSTLIVAEIALSLMLLIGAGLLVRSFVALQRFPLGFEPRGLISADVMFGPRQSLEARSALRKAYLERFRAIPGVTDVAIGTLPGEAWGVTGPTGGKPALETEPDASGHTQGVAEFSTTFMSPGFFRVARMTLLEGRLPDTLAPQTSFPFPPTGAPDVAEEIVINRGLANRFFPRGDAIGAHLHGGARLRTPLTVVGIVNDVQLPGVRSAIKSAQVYQRPIERIPEAEYLVRTTRPPSDVIADIRRIVPEVERHSVLRIAIGDEYWRDSLAPTRFAMALLSAFSVVALVLAAVGLYGVIGYSVSQRTREIGIRVALGADAGAIMRLVMSDGLRLAVAGVVLGAAAAAGVTRALRSMLYAVSPGDPFTFGAIAVLVGAMALVASYVPARRALRVDPTEALRAE